MKNLISWRNVTLETTPSIVLCGMMMMMMMMMKGREKVKPGAGS